MEQKLEIKKHSLEKYLIVGMIGIILVVLLLPVFISRSKNTVVGLDDSSVMKHIREFTKDEYNGRRVGTEENKMAAQYIQSQFEKLGILPLEQVGSYQIPFSTIVPVFKEQPYVKIQLPSGMISLERNVSFIERVEDYSGVGEVKGEIIYFKSYKEISDTEREIFKDKIVAIDYQEMSNTLEDRIDNLISTKNPLGIVYLEHDFNDKSLSLGHKQKYDLVRETIKIGINKETFNQIVKSIENEESPKASIGVFVEFEENVEGHNVVGYLPGKGSIEDDIIVISANYDSYGKGYDDYTYVGAAKNAVATAMLLEIAERLSTIDQGLRKTVVFAAVDGGETDYKGINHLMDKKYFDSHKTKGINLDSLGMPGGDIEILTIKNDPGSRKYTDLFASSVQSNINVIQSDTKIKDSAQGPHRAFFTNDMSAVTITQSNGYSIDRKNDNIDNIDQQQIKKISQALNVVLDHQVFNVDSIKNFSIPALKTLPIAILLLIICILKAWVIKSYDTKIHKTIIKIFDKSVVTYGLLAISCFFIVCMQGYLSEQLKLGVYNIGLSDIGYFTMVLKFVLSIILAIALIMQKFYIFIIPVILIVVVQRKIENPLLSKGLYGLMLLIQLILSYFLGKSIMNKHIIDRIPEALRLPQGHLIFPIALFILSLGAVLLYYLENKEKEISIDKYAVVFIVSNFLLFSVFYGPFGSLGKILG